jgi:hypothetical protein
VPVSDLATLWRRYGAPLLLTLVVLVWYFNQPDNTSTDQATSDGSVEQAFAEQRSGVWLDAGGRVARLLSDDNEGSRHQRFILALNSGHTVLVSHNIDLAERIPVRRGAYLRLHGRYEWNERGGVIHWTHHDPEGSMPGGWIRCQGAVYQ